MMAYVGILGYGEVGIAIDELYQLKDQHIVYTKDINSAAFNHWSPENISCLHVCIPFTDFDSFFSVLKEEIKSMPKLEIILIHSTVAIRTIRSLYVLLNADIDRSVISVVHAPIRGQHETLAENIQNFVMYIGCLKNRDGQYAAAIMKGLGVKTVATMQPPEATELGKLLDTTYYGLCIAFHAEVEKVCDHFQLNFHDVMTRFNTSYNAGYGDIDRFEVLRPTLYPPMNSKIGGHCIIPNAELLKKDCLLDDVVNLILKYKGEEHGK